MTVGIEAIRAYTPGYCIELAELAIARGMPREKAAALIGQKIAVVPPCEDVITMAVEAAAPLVNGIDRQQIGMVLFATESAYDQAKAGATYVARYLKLPKQIIALELKAACFGATGGLLLALTWLAAHPGQKALVIASDIARYAPGTLAELSAGAGAIAFLLGGNPILGRINSETIGLSTVETLDFWRPKELAYALTNGQLSCRTYLKLFRDCYAEYLQKSGRSFRDHAGFCYHMPVARLVETAHLEAARMAGVDKNEAFNMLAPSLVYGRLIGNCYTASLYLGLLSWLENHPHCVNASLGLYSYGSGSSAAYFALELCEQYEAGLAQIPLRDYISARKPVTFETYSAWQTPAADGSGCEKEPSARIYRCGYSNHHPIYGGELTEA